MLLSYSIPRSQKNMQRQSKLLTLWFLSFQVSLIGYNRLQTPVISTAMLLSALAVTAILLTKLISKLIHEEKQEEN